MKFYMVRQRDSQFYYKPSKFRSKENWVPLERAKVYATIGRAKSAAKTGQYGEKVKIPVIIVEFTAVMSGFEDYP